MSDIERAFNFLHDSIPSWFKNVAEIEEKLARLQEEMAKVPIARAPKLKKKTGSIESIRDMDAATEDLTSPSAPFATRKRRAPSVHSGQASAPSKYRSRMMIVVIYDGQVQALFETLVRAIGTGRNLLRKGKMAAKMEELAALAGPDEDSEEDDDDALMAKIGYRHRAGLSSMRSRNMMQTSSEPNTNAITTPVEIFDVTDKALELAQGLCERAAHQSLRDGDCRRELEGVTKHFQEVLDAATKEVAKYVAKREKEQVEDDATVAPSPSAPATSSMPVPNEAEIKPSHPIVESKPAIIPASSKPLDIEVDDDSEDEMDFVMPPIRLTSRV